MKVIMVVQNAVIAFSIFIKLSRKLGEAQTLAGGVLVSLMMFEKINFTTNILPIQRASKCKGNSF